MASNEGVASTRPSIIDHDVHVHTTLSACCTDPESTPANILARAALAGLRTLGFADHLWDSRSSGASGWYLPQDESRLVALRRQVPREVGGIRILVGCESEYRGGETAGIARETARELDFVLLPMSHFHMRGFVAPAGLEDPSEIGALLVERFLGVLRLGLADGIAHPFLPCGHEQIVDRVISSIDDATFARCFGAAAAAGVSIEITLGFFPGCAGGEREGFHDATFLRMLRIARREGCLYHFASDAHRLAGIGKVLDLEPYVRELGLVEADIAPWTRGGRAGRPALRGLGRAATLRDP